MNQDLQDKLLIRELVERWAVWRDAGDRERFSTVWHPDGVIWRAPMAVGGPER